MTKQQLQKAKPIIFDTESVRAVLDNKKTATRSVIKNASPKWTFDCLCDDAAMTVIDRNGNEKAKQVDGLWATFNAPDEYIEFPMIKAKYQVGDFLYVRETWCTDEDMADVFEDSLTHGFYYRANEVGKDWVNDKEIVKWHPSVHMPKEAARIFLRVTDVRVERLQDITEEQAIKEGNKLFYVYEFTWNSKIPKKDLNKYGWNANPYVFVYEFERVEVDNA